MIKFLMVKGSYRHAWKVYLKKLPKDPWGRDYLYLNPGQHGEIDVFTLGADGQPGGKGINAVIGNWDEQN